MLGEIVYKNFNALFAVARNSLLLIVAVAGLTTVAQSDPYRLQAGDVLSLLIVGAPELTQSIRIEADGAAWFPIIGRIEAAGSSLAEVRERVSQHYSETTASFAEANAVLPPLIQPGQVHVTVGEYQPVYVSGDVLRAVALPYRPGLTVRQAVTLAAADSSAEAEQFALRQQLKAAEIALTRAEARIVALRSIIASKAPQDASTGEIAGAERQAILAQMAERKHRIRLIETNIARADARLQALVNLRDSEEEGARLDEEIVANLGVLSERGLASDTRLAEVRRSSLASASRVLEIESEIEDVRTELASLRAEADLLGTEERGAAWSELPDVLSEAQRLRADIAILKPVVATGDIVRDLVAMITRRGEVLSPIEVDAADQLLEPGDVVTVSSKPSAG